jgi:nucleoid-associated protein YgaU
VRARGRAVVAMVFAVGLATGGCGKPVLRVADASLGDYYTDEEFRKLREEQRLEYCQELADQDSTYRAEIADARLERDLAAARAMTARTAADSISRLADSLDARIAAARATVASRGAGAAAGGAAVTVRAGDSLWRISARDTIYGDGRRWTDLYEANRNRIRNADRIYPGQELVVPR